MSEQTSYFQLTPLIDKMHPGMPETLVKEGGRYVNSIQRIAYLMREDKNDNYKNLLDNVATGLDAALNKAKKEESPVINNLEKIAGRFDEVHKELVNPSIHPTGQLTVLDGSEYLAFSEISDYLAMCLVEETKSTQKGIELLRSARDAVEYANTENGNLLAFVEMLNQHITALCNLQVALSESNRSTEESRKILIKQKEKYKPPKPEVKLQ